MIAVKRDFEIMETFEQINTGVKFRKVWAMPDQWTFKIKPIAEIIHRHVGDGKGWVDPFAGENSPAEITNDLNPNRPTAFHLDALDFLIQQSKDTPPIIMEYYSTLHIRLLRQKNVTIALARTYL